MARGSLSVYLVCENKKCKALVMNAGWYENSKRQCDLRVLCNKCSKKYELVVSEKKELSE